MTSIKDQDIIITWPLWPLLWSRSFPRPGDTHRPRVTDIIMCQCRGVGVSTISHTSPHCAPLRSSRRKSAPIWIRSRPEEFLSAIFLHRIERGAEHYNLRNLWLGYKISLSQVNKIELGTRGGRKCVQPKQSWPDLTPAPSRWIIRTHLSNSSTLSMNIGPQIWRVWD